MHERFNWDYFELNHLFKMEALFEKVDCKAYGWRSISSISTILDKRQAKKMFNCSQNGVYRFVSVYPFLTVVSF